MDIILRYKFRFLANVKRILFFSVIIFNATFPLTSYSQEPTFIKGVDVSFLPEEDNHNAIYKDSEKVKEALSIFRDHGINYGRIRIWHTPAGGINNLASTLSMATRIKQQGMKLLLDLHYSDWWADPGHQTKPVAWDSLSFPELVDSVYAYTGSVITALRDQRTLPDMVQIGNEITCGMLWPDGAVCGVNDNPEQWHNLGSLLRAARNAIQNAASLDAIPIMIHTDQGGNMNGAIWFFDHIIQEAVPFDIIGLSYYPWWHGNLNSFKQNLDTLSMRYQKRIIVAETAYPWTLNWNDNMGNIVGDQSQLLPEYPATPVGQKAFIRDLVLHVRNTKEGRGMGVFYWAPDWISAVDFGSAWENLAFFDFNGNLLPVIDALNITAAQMKYSVGWNLMSLPVIPNDPITMHLFPMATSDAFLYADGAYHLIDTLKIGQGFWLKFASTDSTQIIGSVTDSITINAVQGWNLLGTMNKDIPVCSISTEPPDLFESSFFMYGTGYLTVDTLSSGQGYWIKAKSNGKIILK